MKHSSIYIAAALMCVMMASCQKPERGIERNDRGIPVDIAAMIIGDSYCIDTLCASGDVIYIDNPDYSQYIIYRGDEVLANSPTLSLDSLSPGCYRVADILRAAQVDFAQESGISLMHHVFPQYPEFSTVVLGDTSTVGQNARFSFTASVPGPQVRHAQDVQRWVERCIDDTMHYYSNVRTMARDIEREFFGRWPKRESEMQYSQTRSVMVYEFTDDYVTYRDYYSAFMGGAHGMYGLRFVTYSLDDNAPVTCESLFLPGTENDIRELIYEAIAADESFMSAQRITSVSQVRTYIQRYIGDDPLPIPDPGLTADGVIFCYQPYEIAPYAAGSFQLVIPYHKLAPYLAR